MSFQGINFSSQHIVPSDDGRLYEAIFEDGALYGCELSYVGAALTIGAGYLMIGGREIEITEDEVFNINEATSGYAQLVMTIDLTQTATIGAFNQVSIDVRYASTEAGFASLIKDDINGAGTKYQQQLALVSLGTGGITGIVDGMPRSSLKGAGRVFSIIAVTYPEGSVCTCSDGTATLTARDTSGKALFNVTVGEWTVSCTDGTDTASKAVSITHEGQVESVELSYRLYLYKNGDKCTDVGGNWSLEKGYTDGVSVTYDTDYAQLNVRAVSNQYMGNGLWYKNLDITNYSKLCAIVTYNTVANSGSLMIAVCSSATDTPISSYVAKQDIGANDVSETVPFELDISDITGFKYIGIGTHMTGTGSGIAKIKEVYLV